MAAQTETSITEKIKAAKLYCIACPPAQRENVAKAVTAACKGGADAIQLRDKMGSTKKLIELGKKLQKICGDFSALFIVNDRVDVALACGADGVHLGQDDLPVREARKIAEGFFNARGISLSAQFLIGCSTHSLEQAMRAQKEGADYIGCGPIFSTPTKPDVPAVGFDLMRSYRRAIKIPIVAIGGIDATNVAKVIQAGARCIGVVRAVFESADIEGAARSLKKMIAENLQ